MKLKNKIIISILTMIVVLFGLSLFVVNFSEGINGMGFFIILLFLINPLSSIGVSALVGNDIKKIWWIPILFVVIFLISYWLVLQEVIMDFIIYAVVYLILGIITMIISYKIEKRVVTKLTT